MKITFYLKENQSEFSEKSRLEDLVKEALRIGYRKMSRVTYCVTLNTPAKTYPKTKLTPEWVDEQIVDARTPLSILEETAAVMQLAPHEHAQTVEFPQPQFTSKVVDDRVKVQRQVGPTVQVERVVSEFSSATKWRISAAQQKTDNREQMPQEQFQRVHKKIEIPQLQLSQEEMRTKIVHTTLEKTFEERDTLNQAVVRIVKGTARAWSIQNEIREIISPPRSSKQWRCRRKPNTANVRRSCRVKQTSRAKSVKHEERNKIGTVLNSSHQLKIPEHILNRNRRCYEQGIVQQCEDPIE